MNKRIGWLALLISITSFGQMRKPEVVYTIPEKDFIPEGIAYDAATKIFYVGSINKKKIIAFTTDGQIKDFISTGQDGIGHVLGIRVDKNNLWACSGQGSYPGKDGAQSVHQYNLQSGKLVHKYVVPVDGKNHLVNDLIVTNSGHVFVTDTYSNCLFWIDPQTKSIEKFIESDLLKSSNGIATSPDGTKLLISTDLGFLQVDIATKQTVLLRFQSYQILGLDGIYLYNNSVVGIQNVTFPIMINRYYFDDRKEKIQSADILSINDSLFNIPTTGVIIGDWFHFIANSQLDQWDEATGKIKEKASLKNIVIAKIKLN